MTGWEWWAGVPGEDCYDLGNERTREAVIAAALRELKPGERFHIVEARASEAARYIDSDFVPFMRTRNHESFVVGADGQAIAEAEASAAPITPCYCGGDHANGHVVDCPAPPQIEGDQ